MARNGERSYRIVPVNSFCPQIDSRLNDLNELYQLDSRDSVMMIARHYKWNSQAMESRWFDESSKLEITLGISFDTSLSGPSLNASLSSNNNDMCLICGDDLTKESEFALGCGHTFCKLCWVDYLINKV